MTEAEYDEFAKRLLRAEMQRAGVNNAGLAERMTAVGYPETEHTVKAKIGRGSFRAGFLIAALRALGRNALLID